MVLRNLQHDHLFSQQNFLFCFIRLYTNNLFILNLKKIYIGKLMRYLILEKFKKKSKKVQK